MFLVLYHCGDSENEVDWNKGEKK